MGSLYGISLVTLIGKFDLEDYVAEEIDLRRLVVQYYVQQRAVDL